MSGCHTLNSFKVIQLFHEGALNAPGLNRVNIGVATPLTSTAVTYDSYSGFFSAGGLLCFSIRDDHQGDYQEKMLEVQYHTIVPFCHTLHLHGIWK